MECHVALSSQGSRESAWRLLQEECLRAHSVEQEDSLAGAQKLESTVLRGQCLAGPRRGMECQEMYLTVAE